MSKKNTASLKSVAHVDSKPANPPQEVSKPETGGNVPEKAKKVRKPFQPALLESLTRIQKLVARQVKRVNRACKMETLPEQKAAFEILSKSLENIATITAIALPQVGNVPVTFALPKPKQASAAWVPAVGATATWTEAQKATYAFLGVNQVTVMAVTGEGRRMRVTVKGGDTVMVVPRSDLQAA